MVILFQKYREKLVKMSQRHRIIIWSYEHRSYKAVYNKDVYTSLASYKTNVVIVQLPLRSGILIK